MMKNRIKNISTTFIPQPILRYMRTRVQKLKLAKWQRNGYPIPPPHIVKQNTISEYQKEYGCGVLIETGTFLGDMVEAQKARFEQIISIELSNELFHKARKRFLKDLNVKILQGDSGKVLLKLAGKIDEPCVFWLDGHYSGGKTAKGDKNCPIYEELDAIFKTKKLNHILLIDDARKFNGKDGYPSFEELSEYIRSKNRNYQIVVKQDIIRCTT